MAECRLKGKSEDELEMLCANFVSSRQASAENLPVMKQGDEANQKTYNFHFSKKDKEASSIVNVSEVNDITIEEEPLIDEKPVSVQFTN